LGGGVVGWGVWVVGGAPHPPPPNPQSPIPNPQSPIPNNIKEIYLNNNLKIIIL